MTSVPPPISSPPNLTTSGGDVTDQSSRDMQKRSPRPYHGRGLRR